MERGPSEITCPQWTGGVRCGAVAVVEFLLPGGKPRFACAAHAQQTRDALARRIARGKVTERPLTSARWYTP